MAISDALVYGGDAMIFVAASPIAFSTNAKLTVNTKTRDISNKDSSNWVEKKAGRYDWSCSSDAFMNFAATGTTHDITDLYTYFVSGTTVSVAFGSKTGTTPSWTLNTGVKYFTGNAIITSFDMNSPDGETGTYTINLEGNGVLSLT